MAFFLAPSLPPFVADPAQGSRHNRGCAVDLTLYDLASGKPVEMAGTYDEMTPRSCPDYPGGTSLQRWHRDLLRRAMESDGFTVYESVFFFKQKTAYEVGLGIPAEPLFRSQQATTNQNVKKRPACSELRWAYCNHKATYFASYLTGGDCVPDDQN